MLNGSVFMLMLMQKNRIEIFVQMAYSHISNDCHDSMHTIYFSMSPVCWRSRNSFDCWIIKCTHWIVQAKQIFINSVWKWCASACLCAFVFYFCRLYNGKRLLFPANDNWNLGIVCVCVCECMWRWSWAFGHHQSPSIGHNRVWCCTRKRLSTFI